MLWKESLAAIGQRELRERYCQERTSCWCSCLCPLGLESSAIRVELAQGLVLQVGIASRRVVFLLRFCEGVGCFSSHSRPPSPTEYKAFGSLVLSCSLRELFSKGERESRQIF
jgi:hypothetical protein